MLQFPKVLQVHFLRTASNDANDEKGTVDKYRQKETFKILFSIRLKEEKGSVEVQRCTRAGEEGSVPDNCDCRIPTEVISAQRRSQARRTPSSARLIKCQTVFLLPFTSNIKIKSHLLSSSKSSSS